MNQPKFCVKEVFPLFFAILIDVFGYGLVFPILITMFTSNSSILPLNTSNELRFWYLGIAFMLHPFFMFFGSSFMGDLSDKWGRKKVILICMFGLAISFICMGIGVLILSLTLLFIGRGLSGLMSASMPVVLATIADLSSEGNKAVHMSYVTLIQSIGFILGPLMGGVLSDKDILWFFSFALPFFVSAILSLAAFIWIYISFKETFIKNEEKKIEFLRLFKNFYQAAQHKFIRILSIAFFLMQMAVAFYLQLILIYYKEEFNYKSSTMGIFNAYLGVWFTVGLLFIIPYVSRHYAIEKVALFFLFIAGLSEIAASFLSQQISLWLIGIPLAISIQVGFTAMLTSFSNAASKDQQGWAMGITGALIALSFAITGLSPNFVPYFGVRYLIFIGGILMLIATSFMLFYCRKSFLKLQK